MNSRHRGSAAVAHQAAPQSAAEASSLISALQLCAETFAILSDALPGVASSAEPERGAELVLHALEDLRPALRVLREAASRRSS